MRLNRTDGYNYCYFKLKNNFRQHSSGKDVHFVVQEQDLKIVSSFYSGGYKNTKVCEHEKYFNSNFVLLSNIC